MSFIASNLNEPLSDKDYALLDEALHRRSDYDLGGMLGVLHAVAVAPGLIPPSHWLPKIFPKGPGPVEVLSLVMRLYNTVLTAIGDANAITPDSDDIEGCRSFAGGYVDGASLDPVWRNSSRHWMLVEHLAYFSGRDDFVSDEVWDEIEEEAKADDFDARMAMELTGIVGLAHELLREEREGPMRPNASDASRSSPRVGRNDPCPCGSGKKYKKCCLNAPKPS
jgi:uncharacterized protein